MKRFIAPFLLSVFFTLNLFAQNTVTVQTDSGKFIINKNIYGHFSEHLGHCIYDGIYVGDKNKDIPNTNGIRNDVADALKKLKVPLLRWPGGCFADTYHWKDGVGPKDKRASIVNQWWGGITEDNSFGTHEFLNFCKMIGAEPYISGNVGSGTVKEMTDWVNYVNGAPAASPMSKWRVENGQKEPWTVKYWGIGNEAWGCGGTMTPEYYANIFRQYATYLTDVNNTRIFRIASGAGGDDTQWTEVLMKNIPLGMLQGIGVHHYAVINWDHKGSATNFTEKEYYTTMREALRMDDIISHHSAIMDKYDPQKKVALGVDEWGAWYDVEPGTNGGFLYQQNTMRDAVLAGATLNIFNNHCERVRMANLAQIVNVLQAVILTNKEKIILTPTYHVMEMYNVHQDATMLPVKVETENYVFENGELPAISASASKDKNGITHISLTNVDASKAKEVTIELKGGNYKKVSGRILTSDKLQNFNSFDAPDKIEPANFNAQIKDNKILIKIPAFSVVVLNLQ
ncbi:MAG TPA: alpha-L-arabinofuranosidase C-terminal domain-containing protein [Chitinophagaceae bacterium]|nr:alpha-L-arabinofuranosidase C-terminal domain-containing protein [Chitinophagaceae bacterium]